MLHFQRPKQAIGYHDHIVPFQSYSFIPEKGDCVYLFSDGYADQFGADSTEGYDKGGKKFKPSNFKKLFKKIYDLQMKEQKKELVKTFDSWK